jgi:surface polysaccharide O-acyltransferase-like enzyme
MAPISKKIQWLDTLRALAMFGVITIHVSTPLVKMMYGKNMEYWWIGNLVDSAVRFSVPLFLMLSGATLLGKEYNLNDFYKRRITRVFFPILFWMIVYWIYRWIQLSPKSQPHSSGSIIQWGINLFLKEGISKHFWYIYMILVIYIFVPFIGKGIRKLNRKIILYILLGWIILTFACRSIPLNLYNWSGDYISKIFGYFLFSGYIVLGYFLSKISVITTKIKIYAIAVFISSILVSAFLTFYFSRQVHGLDLTIYSYLSINTIIQSLAIFIVVSGSNIKNNTISMFLTTVSDYSFGIYLVHIMVLGIFFNNGIFWTMAHPLVSIPLVTLLTLVTSFVIIYILRKIPFGKYISG